jgi:hypothetical protein
MASLVYREQLAKMVGRVLPDSEGQKEPRVTLVCPGRVVSLAREVNKDNEVRQVSLADWAHRANLGSRVLLVQSAHQVRSEGLALLERKGSVVSQD